MGITAKKIRLFQSTPPVKAATVPVLSAGSFTAISIHAAREGGDSGAVVEILFEPISIHAAREGGDHIVFGVAVALGYISIHAAREGGDPAAGICQPLFAISIHAAREGGDWRCRC